MAVGKRRAGEKKGRIPLLAGISLLLVALAFWWLRGSFREGVPSPDPSQDPGLEQSEQLGEGISGGRKNIYDRNYMELAVSFRRSSIYARPLELKNPEEVAGQVAQVLDLDANDLVKALKGERSFAWLGRDVDQKKAEKIADMAIKGVYRIDQGHRYYPGNQLGAHVIGFLKDAQGLGGVEFYYDSILRGGGVHDPRLAPVGVSRRVVEGSDGASLILTLDMHVQATLEQKMRALMESSRARSGVAVLMVPATGEIVASVSLPDFDPNRYWEYGSEERKNRVVEEMAELAGVGRLFHLAASLDGKAEAVSASVPEPDAGEEALPFWHALGGGVYLSPEGRSLQRFSATGAEYLKFIENIGLSGKGDVDLPEAIFALKEGEVEAHEKTGLPQEADSGQPGIREERELAEAPAPVGKSAPPLPAQLDKEVGATATPMALLSAFCRLVNGGAGIKPHVLSAIWHEARVFPVPPREGGDFALRPEVSHELLSWMGQEVGAGQDVFFLESLIEKKMASASESSGNAENAENAGNAGAGQAGNAVEGEEVGAQSQARVVNALLLGATPASRPEMAVLILLENALVDLAAKSEARRIAQEVLPLAVAAMAKSPSMPSARELKVREVGYYRKWEKIQQEAAARPLLPAGQQRQEMPDLRGLSLRKAMQVLQPYGLKVKVSGSGAVVSQQPQPGATLKGVDQCGLELKMVQ